MKKVLLLLFMTAVAPHLMAQQLIIKPTDSLLFKAPNNIGMQQFKLNDISLFKSFPNLAMAQQLAVLPDFNKAELFYSNMPVFIVGGNIDHIPIAKVEGNIDRMPVKSLKVVPLKNAQPLITP